ncbi:MAG: hypothetical protein K2M19_08175 [Muribaculaceae bacterium]|nr:hypothetical protein [Muribaculaceae bacterium]
MTAEGRARLPWWFVVLMVAVALPSFLFIPEAFKAVSETGWMGETSSEWLFPAYVVLSAVLALACYPGRRTVAWILLGLVVLTDVFILIMMLSNS